MIIDLYETAKESQSYPLYVFLGPSGGGKDTIVQKLVGLYPERFAEVPSVTTREPKDYEADEVHHHFVSEEAFDRLKDSGEIVFSGERYGFSYGTYRSEIEKVRKSGRILLLQTSSVDAVQQIYQAFPCARTVTVVPTKNRTDVRGYNTSLAQRITKRQKSIKSAELRRRIEENTNDMAAYMDPSNWDYIFVNDAIGRVDSNIASLLSFIDSDLSGRDVSGDLQEMIRSFRRMKGAYKFMYPLAIFSSGAADELTVEKLKERNSFLTHAYPTNMKPILNGRKSLENIREILSQLYPDMHMLSASLMGSYVYPWITTNGSDIDINVFFSGDGFQHRIIPVEQIQPEFRREFSPEIERLEIVTIGDSNAVHGKSTNDSFSGATKHDDVVGIITSGLWNRDITVSGFDYAALNDNNVNLLRLSYDLIESAVRRQQNIEMEKPEPEIQRLRKSIGRSHEAMVYLEEIRMTLSGNHRRLFLPREDDKSFTDDEIIFYSEYALRNAISRYIDVKGLLHLS